MGEEEAVQSIVDVREDAVFCPVTGKLKAPKTCYFLRPCHKESFDGSARPPPLHAASSGLKEGQGRQLPERTKLMALPDHSKVWDEWVNLMEPRYCDIWEKVGISNAIKCSTCSVYRDLRLLQALAEKWCPDTNTFVFSWGEATVTLEDVFVLGSYPVRGFPIFVDLEDGEMREVYRRMRLAKLEMGRSSARTSRLWSWTKMYKGSGSDIEHEAFLACWLSRFVFPMPWGSISASVFPLATHLARGNKIALAPAVLAGIYRDLSLAAKSIRGLAALSSSRITRVWLQSNILQVWAWERFRFLQTTPKVIGPDKPRISQWDGVRNLKQKQVQMDQCMNINSYFKWRPYVKDVENFKLPSFYPEQGRQVILYGDNVEDEIWAFARCLVPCELVGFDCIEQYLPHRVAMQFGMDQGIPDHVVRCDENPVVAWETYDISLLNSSLYIPSRYYKPGVNVRYRDWFGTRVASTGPPGRSEKDAEGNNNSFPPGFPSVPLGPNVGEDDDDDTPICQLRSRIRKHRAGRSCMSGGNLSESNKGLAASRIPTCRDVATTFEVALDEGQKAKSMHRHPTSEVALHEEPRGESALSDPTPEEDAEGNKNSFPPCFSSLPLGPNVGESNGEDDDDDTPISQRRSRIRKHRAGRSCKSGGNLSESNKGLAASRSPSCRDVATTFEVALDEGQKAKSMPTRPTSEVAVDEEPRGESAVSDPTPEEERTFKNMDTPTVDPIPQQEIPGRTAWRRSNFEVDMLELELSARINELERNVAAIKAARQVRLPMDTRVRKQRADQL